MTQTITDRARQLGALRRPRRTFEVSSVDEQRREQVALQCAAVAHLAQALSTVRQDYVVLIRSGQLDDLLDSVGAATASQMELLGDVLNNMDAVGDEDSWLSPVFEEAHRLWPQAVTP